MRSPQDNRTADELAKLGYEREDIGLRTIAIWVMWFFVFAVLAGVVTAGIYHFLAPQGFRAPEVESMSRQRFPAEPRLQDNVKVKTDIYDLRRHEDEMLHGYGASEADPGHYRIPIDRAIEEYAARGQQGRPSGSPGATPVEPPVSPSTGVTHDAGPATPQGGESHDD